MWSLRWESKASKPQVPSRAMYIRPKPEVPPRPLS